jgi:hypothetical protein
MTAIGRYDGTLIRDQHVLPGLTGNLNHPVAEHYTVDYRCCIPPGGDVAEPKCARTSLDAGNLLGGL